MSTVQDANMQRLAIAGTASLSPSPDVSTPESSSATAATSAPSTSRSSSKSSLASRNRENQRLSRARRKDYISSLEGRIRDYERQGAQATIEMQRAAREVMDENARLKDLLANNVCGVCRNSMEDSDSIKKRKGSRGQGITRAPEHILTTGLGQTSTTHTTPTSSSGNLNIPMRMPTNAQGLKSSTNMDQAQILDKGSNLATSTALITPITPAVTVSDQFSHFAPPYTTSSFATQVQQQIQPQPRQRRTMADSSASAVIQSDCCSGQTICVPSSPVLVRPYAASRTNTTSPTPLASTSTSCKPSSCCPANKSTTIDNDPGNKMILQGSAPPLLMPTSSLPVSSGSSSFDNKIHNMNNNNNNVSDDNNRTTTQRTLLPDTTECNAAVELFHDMTDRYDSHEIKRMLCPTADSEVSCQVDNGTLFRLLDQFSV